MEPSTHVEVSMAGALVALIFSLTLPLTALEPNAATSALPEGADPNEFVQATWAAGQHAKSITQAAWQKHWRGDQTELLASPRWVRHAIRPRETLGDIAARYGVSVDELREWNDEKLAKQKPRAHLREGTELRVKANRVPPAPHPVSYVVGEGQTWETIAVDHRVDVRDLKAYNHSSEAESMAALEPGRELTIWVDPAIDWTVFHAIGPAVDPSWISSIPATAFSHGHPNRGKIRGEPVQLPEIPELYTRRFDRIAHGSSHAIKTIVTAFANFRHESGYEGEILVGSIARPNGGRFPPHKSHQSGRDVDIRLPMLPWFETTIDPRAEEIDWRAVWALIDAFLATGEVEMIFLDHELQRPLYYAALSLGATPEELDRIITWPQRDGKGKQLIRHARGHDGHIHVRIKCGDDEPTCRTQRRASSI
ncbi:penicillin-insensitive murein endopeptidase [Nannocystaceae bacterium ST9]